MTRVVVGDTLFVEAAEISPGDWNGWCMPAFPHAEVVKIAAWLEQNRAEDLAHWGEENTQWSALSFDPNSQTWTLTNSEYLDQPEVYEPDDAGLYAIGSASWTWEVAE